MSDYTVFATPDFNANDYANAVFAGEPYPPQSGLPRTSKPPGIIDTAREDISVAIGKLDIGIDDVSKQIKHVVTVHHEDLLVQAASLGDLESSFGSVRSGIDDLDTSLDKLRQKIRIPYQSMQANVIRLQRLQLVSEVLRRTSRFVLLAKRLQTQMAELGDESFATQSIARTAMTTNPPGDHRSATPGLEGEGEKERTLAQAALSVAELNDLLDTSLEGILPREISDQAESNAAMSGSRISLQSISSVASFIPFVEASYNQITLEMESMIKTGLGENNRSLLATSLQTAHNLRVLPEFVQDLVEDLSVAVDHRIKAAFDVSRISKELLAKDLTPPSTGVSYKSRIRTEPTSLSAPQWTNALWAKLSSLIEDMAGACIKVYTLENVLKIKKDPVSQIIFLDESMKVLENKPSTIFWTALGRSLEKQCRDASKNSTFIQQNLGAGYPRLLRLFHDFFSRIAALTDTVYTPAQQSTETILVLRALSSFETQYLARVSNRLNESIGQAFQGGTRSPPGLTEGVNVARTVANELDSAKFDSLLLRAVATSVKSSLEGLFSRLNGLVSHDRAANSVAGPAAAPQLVSNAALVSFAYACSSRLGKLKEEYPQDIYHAVEPTAKQLQATADRVVNSLLATIKRELSALIARVHAATSPAIADAIEMGGSSLYVKELVEKLAFIKTEIIVRFNVEEAMREWTVSIVRYVMKTFVLHSSIVKPLGESRKLQLTNDMTELEFALSAFLVQSPQAKRGGSLDIVGEDYKILRAMRPLLFLDSAALASPQQTAGLPPLIVLHHILVRSPISLPHTLHGWLETEYVRWLEEHSEEEALTLIDGGLSRWESVAESEGTDPAVEYVQLARTVLANAKHNKLSSQ